MALSYTLRKEVGRKDHQWCFLTKLQMDSERTIVQSGERDDRVRAQVLNADKCLGSDSDGADRGLDQRGPTVGAWPGSRTSTADLRQFQSGKICRGRRSIGSTLGIRMMKNPRNGPHREPDRAAFAFQDYQQIVGGQLFICLMHAHDSPVEVALTASFPLALRCRIGSPRQGLERFLVYAGMVKKQVGASDGNFVGVGPMRNGWRIYVRRPGWRGC